MTFLTPIPAIIAACIATPILLLYYFLKLRRRSVRVGSTLLWERATKDLQVNAPFRWLRLSLLFLLQLFILAMLLLAIARPTLDDPLGAGRRVILLIDRSASMNALDGVDTANADESVGASRVSRLRQAKLEASRILDSLQGGGWSGWVARLFGASGPPPSVCVIDFAAVARVRTPFTTDPAGVREAIDSLAPTDQPGNIAAALQLVAGLTSGPTDEAQPTEPTTVFVLSDGSFEHDPREMISPRATLRYVQIGPTPVQPERASEGSPAGPPSPPSSSPSSSPPARVDDSIGPGENLGITAVSARRDAESPSIVRVFVRVQSTAPRLVRGVARLSVDGVEAQARTFAVGPADRSFSASAAASPGSAAESSVARAESTRVHETPVTFEIERPEGGTLVVTLGVSDLLGSDDAAAVVLSPAGKPRILVVAADSVPDELLMLALDGLAPAVLTSVEPAYYEQLSMGGRLIDAAGNEVTARLSEWDLIVFDRYRPERLPPSATPTISLGAGLPIPGLSVRPDSDPENATARFSTWRRTHPIMRSVNLDGILLAPPMRLSLPDSPSINATVLAWSDNSGGDTRGSVPLIALLEPVGGAGGAAGDTDPPLGGAKRLVLAFELSQTNWGIEFSFPVFMVNAVEYLAVQRTGLVSRSYRTDEPISISLPAGVVPAGARSVTIDGPVTLTTAVRRSASTGSASALASPADVTIGTLERAGIYRLRAAGADIPPALGELAVNLTDPWESRAAVATRLDLPESGSVMLDSRVVESRREVWHWFVGAALLLLTLEWFWFARGMRS